MTNQQQEWLDFAKSVALEAGDVMRRYFGKNSDTHLKADNTIVTVADEEINQLVIQRVVEKYPDHDVDIAAAKIIVDTVHRDAPEEMLMAEDLMAAQRAIDETTRSTVPTATSTGCPNRPSSGPGAIGRA